MKTQVSSSSLAQTQAINSNSNDVDLKDNTKKYQELKKIKENLIFQQTTNNCNIETKQNNEQTLSSLCSSGERLIDFYSNKTLFVTGITGFIGKVFLFRLIASLSSFNRVFLLMRGKANKSAKQRLSQILSQEPFDILANQSGNENVFDKIIAVEGDMQFENLGLSCSDLNDILSKTQLVFNIAASVQFDAPLKQNLLDNYVGTKNLLHLCGQMQKLDALIHVSTFYTNCHKKHIDEKILELEFSVEQLAHVIDWLPEDTIESNKQLANKLLENRPNTYIITKAMSENLVQKLNGKFPIAVVRPSIVVPSICEPFGGWVDSINGPMGLGALASIGIVRYVDWNYYANADIIPVDTCANVMLAAAERAVRLNKTFNDKSLKVYNLTTTTIYPQTWGQIFEQLRAASIRSPPLKMLRTPINPPKIKRANKLVLYASKLSEILFAYFIDFLLIVCGQKRILVKITAKLHRAYEILLFFMTNEFTSSVDNFVSAHNELHPDDKQSFGFDMTKVDWNKYFDDAYLGTRSKILRENPTSIPAAKTKMQIIYYVGLTFQLISAIGSIYFVHKYLFSASTLQIIV